MLIILDSETAKKDETGFYKPVLDATGENVILTCILKDSGAKKFHKNREECWNYLIKSGRNENKRGKALTVLCHNAKYDFYNIANLKDTNIRYFSEDPFIASYYETITKTMNEKEFEKFKVYARLSRIRYEWKKIGNEIEVKYKKEIIKFGDTMSLFRMSVKRLGECLKLPKLNMEEAIKPTKRITNAYLERIKPYILRDCEIPMLGVKTLKEKLRENGIEIRRLCTINQVAISYVIKKIQEKGECEHFLFTNKQGEVSAETIKTKYADEIHNAYRGGLVRAWKLGKLEDVNDIDCNSLYPYCASIMRFPDLRTERKIYKPLEIYKQENLLEKIGISKVLVLNEKDELGLLPVRLIDKAYIPLSGKCMLGTYTHKELQEAIKNGYKIINIEWSIIYEDAKNILKEVYEEIYDLKKRAENDFEKLFYKSILNCSIGKFAQRRTGQELFIDSVEKVKEYLEKNYRIIKGMENSTNVMYAKEEDGYVKSYYAPIVSALVTAEARVFMYKQLKKIPLNELCYMDTDSIIFQGNHLEKFKIGKEMGEFKIEEDIETGKQLIKTDATIWGTKTKRVGNNLAVSGAFKSELTKEQFEKGIVKSKKMMGMKNLRNEEIGKFVEEERDLKEQMENFEKSEEILKQQKLFIDNNEKDINFFLNDLLELALLNKS